MAIKFSCPNCGKALSVKDQLAGKRGACSGCKKVITIPYPVSEAHHADVEAAAMEAFAEEPVAAAPVEVKTIAFTCRMCDEKVQVPAEMEGKQTPCPACRRIVKVPLQVKNEPKDWRRIDTRGPALAKQNLEPAPEGAWGSTHVAGVSRQTLLETGAIAEEEDPNAKRQRLMRFTTAGIAIVVLALGGIGGYSFFTRGKADKYLERALEMTKGKSSKLTPEQVAAVHWAAGEYQLRSGQPDAAAKASDAYGQARGALGKAASLERDAMLVELALAQIDLGGDKAEADEGRALEWSKALGAARQTLEQVRSLEAKAEGVRQVVRRLTANGQVRAAQSLGGQLGGAANSPGDKPEAANASELTAVAALELLRSGNQKEGLGLAEGVLAPPAPNKRKASQSPPVAPSVVAVAVVLGKEEPKPRRSGKEGEEKPSQEDLDSIRVGKAEGLARRGEMAVARGLLGSARPAVRLRGLVALAGVAADATPGETGDLTMALDLAGGEVKGQDNSPWLFLRLVQLAVRAGLTERAVQLAGQIPDAGLKAQAQLVVVRARLAGTKEKADEAIAAGVGEGTGAAALARQALARHNMARDSGTANNVEGWSDGERAAGLAGVALGMQDKRR